MSKTAQRKRSAQQQRTAVQTTTVKRGQLQRTIDFWLPYIKLIGIANFDLRESQGIMPAMVVSKHYCGFDASLAEGAESVVQVACNRANFYNELIAKDDLTIDDIRSLLANAVCHQFYDEELLLILTKYAHCLTDEEHWKLITDYWPLQEMNCDGERRNIWRKVFKLRSPFPSLTAELSDTFVAYRAGDKGGFSWTLSKETAEWFQQRFSMQYKVPLLTKTFRRENALFYTNCRNEQEVVIIQ